MLLFLRQFARKWKKFAEILFGMGVKLHLVNWDTIKQRKEKGPGVRNLVMMIKALVEKMCWHAFYDPSQLWVRCIIKK